MQCYHLIKTHSAHVHQMPRWQEYHQSHHCWLQWLAADCPTEMSLSVVSDPLLAAVSATGSHQHFRLAHSPHGVSDSWLHQTHYSCSWFSTVLFHYREAQEIKHVLWEEPHCHPSRQKMDSPAACVSCATPTMSMLHPHHSATCILYVTLLTMCCPSHPPKRKNAPSLSGYKPPPKFPLEQWKNEIACNSAYVQTETLNFTFARQAVIA